MSELDFLDCKKVFHDSVTATGRTECCKTKKKANRSHIHHHDHHHGFSGLRTPLTASMPQSWTLPGLETFFSCPPPLPNNLPRTLTETYNLTKRLIPLHHIRQQNLGPVLQHELEILARILLQLIRNLL
jgi:hypothetical protein